jgi:hypothetical protein
MTNGTTQGGNLMPYPKSRRDHLRITETDDGGLAIYDQTRDDGHLLNLTAATVYQLADGTRSIETMTAEVAARTSAPAEPDLVILALNELDRAGLLESDDDTSPRPAIDRRRFLLRLGLVASAAALVPLVETITRVSQAAPTAMHASTNQHTLQAAPPTRRPTLPPTAPPASSSYQATTP